MNPVSKEEFLFILLFLGVVVVAWGLYALRISF